MINFNTLIHTALTQYATQLHIAIRDISSVNIVKIGHGENNHILKATIRNNVFIFRIPHRPELVPKLKAEFKTLQFIPKGIGPEPIVFHEGSDTYMIQSCIDGAHVTKWSQPLLQAHVQQMAKLHSFTQKACNHIDILHLFQAKVEFRKVHDPEVLADLEIMHLLTQLLVCIEKSAHSFADVTQLTFTHGDLHKGNILADDTTIHYVDWEEAHYGDSALDVAGILLSADPPDLVSYLDLYQQATHHDHTLATRIIVWLLYKELSLLLHKKWESLDPKNRAIHSTQEEYPKMLQQIMTTMRIRIGMLK